MPRAIKLQKNLQARFERSNDAISSALLAVCAKYHCNKRKNGDAEIIHQLELAIEVYSFNLPTKDKIRLIRTLLGHDLFEDYLEDMGGVSGFFNEMKENLSHEVDPAVLEKELEQIKIDIEGLDKTSFESTEVYYESLCGESIRMIAKLMDRKNNKVTMACFTSEKKKKYIEETKVLIEKSKRCVSYEHDHYDLITSLRTRLKELVSIWTYVVDLEDKLAKAEKS